MNKRELVMLSPNEVEKVITRFISENERLASKGEPGLAVCFEGEAGI